MGGYAGPYTPMDVQAHIDAIEDDSTRIVSFELCMHHAYVNQLNYRYNNGATFYGRRGAFGNTYCHPWNSFDKHIVEI